MKFSKDSSKIQKYHSKQKWKEDREKFGKNKLKYHEM